MAGRDPKPIKCVNCKIPLGIEAKEIPVHVTDGEDPTKAESWCPQCFVHKRAVLEPQRWVGVRAIQCHCGVRSVDFSRGTGRTNCCRKKSPILTLPPRPAVAIA